MGKYDDIIFMENPKSKKHKHMSMKERAAQFSPFAALTGYEDEIDEAGRITSSRTDIGEYDVEILNDVINELASNIESHPTIDVLYFIPDKRKNGGSYEHYIGNIKEINSTERFIKFTSKKTIMMDFIYKIEEIRKN